MLFPRVNVLRRMARACARDVECLRLSCRATATFSRMVRLGSALSFPDDEADLLASADENTAIVLFGTGYLDLLTLTRRLRLLTTPTPL